MQNTDHIESSPSGAVFALETAKLGYSIKDVVKATCLGRSYLYEEIAAGRLIAHKAGSRTVILHDDLQAFLRALPVLHARAR